MSGTTIWAEPSVLLYMYVQNAVLVYDYLNLYLHHYFINYY